VSVPALRTARLKLRPLEPKSDASAVLAWWSDPRFGAYLIERPPTSLDEVRERLGWLDHTPHGLGCWFCLDGNDTPVGRVSLRRWVHDRDGPPELGWHFAPAHWGQGLAVEAVQGVLGHALGIGWTEVIAVVRTDNIRSVGLAERLGGRATTTGHWYGPDWAFTRYAVSLPVVSGRGRALGERDGVGAPGR
jgi:RimJ/RimL family protein N-acetyltransferase